MKYKLKTLILITNQLEPNNSNNTTGEKYYLIVSKSFKSVDASNCLIY